MHFEVQEEQVGHWLTVLTREGAENVGYELIETVVVADARHGALSDVEAVIVPALKKAGGSMLQSHGARLLREAGFPATNVNVRLTRAAARSEHFHQRGKHLMLSQGSNLTRGKFEKKAVKKAAKAAAKKDRRGLKRYEKSARDIVVAMVQKASAPLEPSKVHERFRQDGRGASSSSSTISQLLSADVLKRDNEGNLVPGKNINGAA
jgi:hypothetical protein